jgi:hypothetical protein
MKKHLLIYVLLIFVILSGCKTKKLTIVNPQESIETAIIDCINLLEKEKYTELLSKYIHPDVREDVLKHQTMEELAENFKGKKADRLLKALKIAQNMDVEYDKEGTLGVIKLGEDFEGPKELEFMKKGQLWYIAD